VCKIAAARFAAVRHLRPGREDVEGSEHEQPDQRYREQRGDGLQPPGRVEDAVGRDCHGHQPVGRGGNQEEAAVAVDLGDDAPTKPTGLVLARKDVAELELLGSVVRRRPGRVRGRVAHGRRRLPETTHPDADHDRPTRRPRAPRSAPAASAPATGSAPAARTRSPPASRRSAAQLAARQDPGAATRAAGGGVGPTARPPRTPRRSRHAPHHCPRPPPTHPMRCSGDRPNRVLSLSLTRTGVTPTPHRCHRRSPHGGVQAMSGHTTGRATRARRRKGGQVASVCTGATGADASGPAGRSHSHQAQELRR
jgi:hypothetical protein